MSAVQWKKSLTGHSFQFSLYQRTPIHIAAQGDHLSMVKSLFDKGADNDIQDNAGVRMYMQQYY